MSAFSDELRRYAEYANDPRQGEKFEEAADHMDNLNGQLADMRAQIGKTSFVVHGGRFVVPHGVEIGILEVHHGGIVMGYNTEATLTNGPGGHVFVGGECVCGHKTTDDPERCPLTA